jgi:asparagine synthase (glutamine-hydrolysing)
MCGICGVATRLQAPPTEMSLRRMCDSIIHRGPDDEGLVLRDGVGLGVRRLSIIDLQSGHQPIANEDETIWIVFNGEIYNYPELRSELGRLGHRYRTQTDTEVVVHAYEQWGDACVERLNGMFGFAIWDGRERRLLLARDRLGIKPLYFRLEDRRLVFGSELKAILQAPDIPREIDPVALRDYLAFEYVPSPKTIFRGINKLPPGTILTWSQADGRHAARRYWDVDLSPGEAQAKPRPLEQEAEELRRILHEVVRKELISDVPVGVFLSGGIDSSTVAAMMAEITPGNVNSFSIGFADRSFDESSHARRVAQHLGTNHRELVLDPDTLLELVPKITSSLDEPLADASIVPTYLLCRFAREHVKVALGGDGGDELFAGYPTLQAHRLLTAYGLLPGFMRRGVLPALVNRLPTSMDNISADFQLKRFVNGATLGLPERHLAWLGAYSGEALGALLTPSLKAAIAEAGDGNLGAEHLKAGNLRNPLNQVLYLDMKMFLENDILVKLDRASMLASLEARVPLLNVELVEHVARLPLALKLRGLQSKFLLKRAMAGRLPADILHRKKKGFGIPVAKWFLGPLKDVLLEAVNPDKIQREGLLDPTVVRQLLDDHFSRRRDNRKQLWTLFVFERWRDAWLLPDRQAAQASVIQAVGQGT